MWIMLNDAFFSIVHKDCKRDELLVRARRKGDIEKVFPNAKVVRVTHADYLFRAAIARETIEAAMVGELRRINYGNFKSSVQDKPLHDAYLKVWNAMADTQPIRPYSGGFHQAFDFETKPSDEDTSIDELNLPLRAYAALMKDGVTTIGGVMRTTELKLLRTPNFGRVSLKALRTAMNRVGHCIGEKVEADD
jgi:hypothetical protein